jgi:hypothetical protein
MIGVILVARRTGSTRQIYTGLEIENRTRTTCVRLRNKFMIRSGFGASRADRTNVLLYAQYPILMRVRSRDIDLRIPAALARKLARVMG